MLYAAIVTRTTNCALRIKLLDEERLGVYAYDSYSKKVRSEKMNSTVSVKHPLTKTELGSIVGFIAIVTAWVFISGHMGAESARKDNLLREYENAVMDCLKAKEWSAPNREELCQKANDKRAIAEQEFGKQ